MKNAAVHPVASPFNAAALALALATGLAAAGSQAASVTEQRALAPFHAIDVSGPYDIVIRAQGKHALELRGDSKQLAEIDTRVSGDTLIVRPASRNGFSFNFGRRTEPVRITITAAMLNSLKMSGSGDVTLEQVNSDKLQLSASGPGDLHGDGSVRDLVLDSSGSGDVDLQRLKSANVKLTMSGPGDVQLSGPMSRFDGEVRGSGGLDVRRLQAQSVRIVMDGPGDVTLEGDTASLNAELKGSGALDASRLNSRNAAVRSRGPGDIELATVSGTLEAELRGAGSLEAALDGERLALVMSGPGEAHLHGKVGSVNAQLSGSGDLEARQLLTASADVVVRGPGSASVSVQEKPDPKNARPARAYVLNVDRRGARQTHD